MVLFFFNQVETWWQMCIRVAYNLQVLQLSLSIQSFRLQEPFQLVEHRFSLTLIIFYQETVYIVLQPPFTMSMLAQIQAKQLLLVLVIRFQVIIQQQLLLQVPIIVFLDMVLEMLLVLVTIMLFQDGILDQLCLTVHLIFVLELVLEMLLLAVHLIVVLEFLLETSLLPVPRIFISVLIQDVPHLVLLMKL